MKTFKDGGPAFPVTTEHGSVFPLPGISVRDYFAAAALQGVLMNYTTEKFGLTEQSVAEYAYSCADAMLIARAKTKEAQS